MRHERRTMEMNGKCHKIGRAVAAVVLSGRRLRRHGSGRYCGLGCRQCRRGDSCRDSRESGRTGAGGTCCFKSRA